MLKYIVFFCLAIFFSCNKTHEISKVITVTGGEIQGYADEASGVSIFKGIPFAAPPMGDLRWKAPQPVEPWEGIKECREYGPSPFQSDPVPFMCWSSEFLIPPTPISEDCLYLNVWTPAKTTEDKKPVLVYIYGGGFRSGGSGCPIYDGLNMAKKDVIFVSLNYRVGTFGFFAHPELSKESEYESSGNYGILDMVAGLQWVQENIEKFGGDPEKVTIAGQSAGAFGVNYLCASPLAEGLFRSAIAESGASFYSRRGRPLLEKEVAESFGIEFMKELGTENINELRKVSADKILNAPNPHIMPFVDGYVMNEPILETYLDGEQNDVNLLLGWNKEDVLSGSVPEKDTLIKLINTRFGDFADEFLAVYPVEKDEDVSASHFSLNRDENFGFQSYKWGKTQTQTGKQPVYMYNFNRELPAYTPKTDFGAFHSGEIVYAYDNLHTLDRPWTESDRKLADQMSTYWANFVKTGNPNGSGLPHWDAYNASEEKLMILDTTLNCVPIPDLDKMKVWEQYYKS